MTADKDLITNKDMTIGAELVVDKDMAASAFELLRAKTSSYMDESDIFWISKAYKIADDAHHGQVRKSGEAFINHPVQVAIILAELRMDLDTIVAALLHDTVEDSSMTLEDVRAAFSEEVMALVDGVTKITRLEIESLSEQQANNVRKMLVAMSKDIRVIVIKLADRLHNMRTLQALREDRRIFKARETMEIYAPLAHRLGINSLKWELEDLSFYYLDPVRFGQIQRMVAESRTERELYLDSTIAALCNELEKTGVEAKITGRPKHLYSIYQKMKEKGKDFSEIYDLIALRLVVETIPDCYVCLGAVHTLWRPMPGRFKDYINVPKSNGYKSLHTTVIGPANRPLEIQIRTKEMHRHSEYGVAAHWRYKGRQDSFDSEFNAQLVWLRQMLDWAIDEEDPKVFLDDFKYDLDYTEVFVFTPKGEVFSLRTGSTPIDFAYAVHTEIGNHCIGAKVNGNIVPLSHELQTGDRVEILTQNSSGPSRDWLAIVKTPSARQKIRSYLSRVSRSDDIIKGREALTREMRKHGLGISAQRSTQAIKSVALELRLNSPDDLFAQIGAGKLRATQVANKLLKILVQPSELSSIENKADAKLDELTSALLADPALNRRKTVGSYGSPKAGRQKRPDQNIEVKGVDSVLVRLSHCCNPVPGDDIIGFITRGRGVSVHRSNCPNARQLMTTPERIIEVAWIDDSSAGVYNVEIFIEAIDRLRLLQDVTSVLANSGVNIIGANSTTHRDGIVEMRFLFELAQIEAIDKILKQLKQINGIIDATRMMPGQAIRKHRAISQ